jgi:hypothetical protein
MGQVSFLTKYTAVLEKRNDDGTVLSVSDLRLNK